ncbi:MAG: DEAD/DEAH box helicase [Deltaproteobacteria bacterium]|jgi:superfamily II RNA helicase|nr:DEAD/DEAH box helicase [Deltaproteobacteria bacterium]
MHHRPNTCKSKERDGARTRRAKHAGQTPPVRPSVVVVHPAVQRSLADIGVPPDSPFVPDPFQLEAVRLAAEQDVIVSAPTGSGKTWIAREALARELAAGRLSWYASPLKALSNSKFLEFGQLFGEENVGLVTGDHKINVEAPIVVGTTEILRNQLYDAMTGFSELACDLVVLDEAHYLGDRERGVVWEEVLIYLPPRVRLLLLSATIENAQELAAWLGRNRGQQTRVVQGGRRPVPLEALCLKDSTWLTTLSQAADQARGRGRGRHAGGGFDQRVEQCLPLLSELNLLPAIFFLKSRADCDLAVARGLNLRDEPLERQAARSAFLDQYLAERPVLAKYSPATALRRKGLAAHHAGHLPQYKMLVEELMTRNLLSAIFATSTVAAGVNFPARTVVLAQSDRFDGLSFSDLTATELAQMTGRAGRRGLDNIGFALVLPGPHMNLRLVDGLFDSPPDPVRSSLSVSFSMVLNLLNAYQPKDVPQLLARTLAAWQRAKTRGPASLKRAALGMWKEFERHMAFLTRRGLLTADGRLTELGLTATALRLEHPLVVLEAALAGGLPLDPPLLAGMLASLLSDKEARHASRLRFQKTYLQACRRLESVVDPLVDQLRQGGFPWPVLNWRAGFAIHCWATGANYQVATEILGLAPGDLVRLALLTAEHLSQLSRLPGFDQLSTAATLAKKLILREPVR